MVDVEFLKIKRITIGGINNPTLSIIGHKDKLCNLFAKIDGNVFNLTDDIRYGRNYLETIVDDNIQFVKFHNNVCIPKESKEVQIYAFYNNKEFYICTKKTNYFKRIIFKLIFVFIQIYAKFKNRIYGLIKRIKRYYKHPLQIFKRKSGLSSFYYNPLIQDDYLKWLHKNHELLVIKKLKYNPLFSVIVPVYNVKGKYLEECINSVLNQTYKNFELILIDDCSTNKETLNVLKQYDNISKIKIIYRNTNGHISEASNTGINVAKGEFISLLDNDDVLDKNALYYVAMSLNENKKIDLIYTDEDKLLNGKYFYPHFKPDYSPDTLYSVNYICHFTTVRTSIVKKLGGFRSEYNGAQDYDLFLRIIEKTNRVHHIPKILYHWRVIPSSTAASGNNKNYAYLAGKKAIVDSLKRRNIQASVHLLENIGMYDVEYLYKTEPKISIIIPTKDKSELLNDCLKSIYSKTNYKNYEIIVINNNSVEKETFDLLNKYKKNKKNFDYITLNCEFNFSYINNEAVKKAKGDYIVLLNNDIEIISKNWLSKMVGFAAQKHVGCVGIKLLYSNNTVQHCGVVLGCGGVASHAFLNSYKTDCGYFNRLCATYNYGAVTAACLMISKEKYNLVNGLDENLKVAYNDVDLNIKMLSKGFYNVCIPTILAYHYESVSRGSDLDSKNKARFISEMIYMANKWGKGILNDSFYNENLSQHYPFYLDKKRGYNVKK